MLADKLINATYQMVCTLEKGSIDKAFIDRWLDTMIDITEGVKDVEGAAIPDRQRAVPIGPNVVDFMNHRARRDLSRAQDRSRL
jgi:hypothetical protein